MPLDGLTLIETKSRQPERPSLHVRRVGPIGAALLGHVLVLALAARLVIHALPGPPETGGFPLFLEQVEPVGAATIPAAGPVFDQLAQARPMIVAAPDDAAMHQVAAHHAGTGRRASPAHDTASGQPATAATHKSALPQLLATGPAAPADDGRALLPGLESRIDDAVRTAAILPDAARRQRREGRAQIRFIYRDGGVQDAQIVASSESRLLDNAALQAVRNANYPQPPAPLRGRQLTLLIWIDFRLVPQQG